MAKAKKKTAKKAVKKVKCAARTKAGKACPRYAVGRSKYCFLHKRKK